MRVYRTEKEGIKIFRLSGVVCREDATTLLRFIGVTPGLERGCRVIDFSGVEHVEYSVFEMFEERFDANSGIVMSGLSDYILDIYAFISNRNVIPVFPHWRKAMHYLIVEHGKMGTPAELSLAGT